MSNEQYLIVSYFTVGGLSIAIALAVYAVLRRPVAGVARALSNRPFAALLKKIFPAGLLLPSLAGFLSVSYRSCDEKYASIIADRSYLIGKNQDQLSAICVFLMLAVLGWGIVILLGLSTQRNKPRGEGERDPNH